MITLEQSVELVWTAFHEMFGGEIFVKKIPSMFVTELAKAIAPNATHNIIGVRPGEKIHEQMISLEDARFTYEYDGYYKILPSINNWHNSQDRIGHGIKVPDDFVYESGTNTDWMERKDLLNWIDVNKEYIGVI